MVAFSSLAGDKPDVSDKATEPSCYKRDSSNTTPLISCVRLSLPTVRPSYEDPSTVVAMLLSFALLFSSCYTTLAALTRPPVVLTPASYNGLPTSSPPRSLTPSDADVHVELRALLRQPSVTLSTYYTTRPSPPVEARAETTLAPQIIGYTSTQGICKCASAFMSLLT